MDTDNIGDEPTSIDEETVKQAAKEAIKENVGVIMLLVGFLLACVGIGFAWAWYWALILFGIMTGVLGFWVITSDD